MSAKIQNMRIRFYGTQGSGSTFPSQRERDEYREQLDCELLRHVLQDVCQQSRQGKSLTLESLLGSSMNQSSLQAYRRQFALTEPRVYGGWTTCVRVETSDGYDIVLDCGSGFRHCAQDLQKKWGDQSERDLYIFGSHSHLDHTEGFDQAAVCFDPRNRIHVYGNCQFLGALDSKLGIFTEQVSAGVEGVHTPISYAIMPATFDSCAIQNSAEKAIGDDPLHHKNRLIMHRHDQSDPIEIGETQIIAFEVDHPAPCLAYRIQHRDKVFLFCTDHELRHEDPNEESQQKSEAADALVAAHAADADVVYRDGQYLRAEYDGFKGIGDASPVPRLGWGHSCLEDVVEMAEKLGIPQTYIGHHDPNRTWGERNAIDEGLSRRSQSSSSKIELARAETVVDL